MLSMRLSRVRGEGVVGEGRYVVVVVVVVVVVMVRAVDQMWQRRGTRLGEEVEDECSMICSS